VQNKTCAEHKITRVMTDREWCAYTLKRFQTVADLTASVLRHVTSPRQQQ